MVLHFALEFPYRCDRRAVSSTKSRSTSVSVKVHFMPTFAPNVFIVMTLPIPRQKRMGVIRILVSMTNCYKINSSQYIVCIHFRSLIVETKCLAPANIIGAVATVGNLSIGSKVMYRPQDNYRYVGGDLVRTCREDELWTGEQPVFNGNIPLIGSITM